PINIESKYAKVIGLDRVKLVYENNEDMFIVWVMSDMRWTNIPDWEKVNLVNGSTAYYHEHNHIQMIRFRKKNVEYAIDYKGKSNYNQDEFIKIASSLGE